MFKEYEWQNVNLKLPASAASPSIRDCTVSTVPWLVCPKDCTRVLDMDVEAFSPD